MMAGIMNKNGSKSDDAWSNPRVTERKKRNKIDMEEMLFPELFFFLTLLKVHKDQENGKFSELS